MPPWIMEDPKWYIVDIFSGDRLVGEMRIPAPADALRAARALLNLTQESAAERAGVLRRSLSTVETSERLPETNLKMVDFYVAQGIEFLGVAKIGGEITQSGAKWSAPNMTDSSGRAITGDFHVEAIPVSLRAARALCNKEQAEIAEQAKMARETVKAAEKGNWWTPSHRALQDYYESIGIEFTGWGETATGKFYGVGVRWK